MGIESQAAGARTFPRPSWSAVIAGVFLAIAAHIVLGLVGAAIGFAAEPADSRGVGAAAAVWALVTPFVATLLGAWLASRMAAAGDDKRSANVHGILVWCVGLIAGAVFLTGTMAAGAVSAGTAASGNLGPAQRMFRADAGAARPGSRAAEARSDEAAKRAAAGAGGAALGALAGLLGAVVGAGLSTRRGGGRGLAGWRIERRPAGERAGQERYAATTTTHGEAPRVPATPAGAPPDVGATPSDPYHH
jgi:hypothetical protein